MLSALTLSALLVCSVSASRFTPGSVVALRLSNGGSELRQNHGNAVYLDEVTTDGSKLQSIAGPASCTIGAAPRLTYVYEGHLQRSVDRRLDAYTCFDAAAGTPIKDASRQIVTIDPDGALAPPVATSLSGGVSFAALRVSSSATSGYYHGATSPNGIYYTPAGGGSSVLLTSQYDVTAIVVFQGSLCKEALERQGRPPRSHAPSLPRHADFASPSAGNGVYLAGSAGSLPTGPVGAPVQVTGPYNNHEWTTSFAFESRTKIWTTDEGYDVG